MPEVCDKDIIELIDKAFEFERKTVFYQASRGQISLTDAFFKINDVEKGRERLLEMNKRGYQSQR